MIILHNFVVRRLLKLKSACPRHSDLEDHHQPLREEPARHEGKAPAKHRPSLSPGGSRRSPVGAVRPPLVPQDRRGRCRPHTALPPPRLGARPPPFPPQRRASRLRANGSREKGGEGGAAILSPRPPGASMEPCGGGGRLGELRREAAEYYRGQRVPQRVEEALNALFPLCPADLYGALVPPGGVAVREAPAPAAPEGGRGAAAASGRAEAWPRFPSAPSAPTCP